MIILEFHAGSSELKALVREFRSHAIDFLDMLDSSLPIVAKVKVWCKKYSHVILILIYFSIINTISLLFELCVQRMLSTLPDHQLADIVSSIVTSTRKEKIEVLNATDLEVKWCAYFKIDPHKLLQSMYIYLSGSFSSCASSPWATTSWAQTPSARKAGHHQKT